MAFLIHDKGDYSQEAYISIEKAEAVELSRQKSLHSMLYLLINNSGIVKEYFGPDNKLAELMKVVEESVK